MIIDKILDRYDGDSYEPRVFYWDMLSYGGHGIQISKAMDFGTEEDVKKALCEYIDGGEYNPLIKDFINKANWLVPDKGTNWREIVAIKVDFMEVTDMDRTNELVLRAEELERVISSEEEIEIDDFDGEIWICRYSETRGSAELIEKFCNRDEIDIDELKHQCSINNWWYVL